MARVRCVPCVARCYINNTWREPWSVELRRPYLSRHNIQVHRFWDKIVEREGTGRPFSASAVSFPSALLSRDPTRFSLSLRAPVIPRTHRLARLPTPLCKEVVTRSRSCRTTTWDLPRARWVTFYRYLPSLFCLSSIQHAANAGLETVDYFHRYHGRATIRRSLNSSVNGAADYRFAD